MFFYIVFDCKTIKNKKHMNKKLLTLLICLLVASSGLYAQSTEFIYKEYTPPAETTVDTVVQQPEEIHVTKRTWDNLESELKSEIISLSKNPIKRKVSRENIAWIYQVSDVPTSVGKQTVYLSILKGDIYGFFLSKENPQNAQEICECYLDIELPERIIYTPGARQTDNDDYGQPETTGNNRKIPKISF